MSETNAVPGQSAPEPQPVQQAPVQQAPVQQAAVQPPGVPPPPGMAQPPGVQPPPGVAQPTGQKKGLGCWAIGAIVVGALLVLGALVTLVFALFVANEVENMDTGTTTTQGELTGGGVYATEELESVDFLLADDEVVFDDSDLFVEVRSGELLVTSRNADQFNMATWTTNATPGLMMSGVMSFPASTTASGQEVFGGVAVGMADDVDYVLVCSTEGSARLERLEPLTSAQESAVLREFPNAGCSGTFTLALEAYAPAGATSTELMGTLPSGETFTFTDPGAHGQVVQYGLLVDADTAPVMLAVSSIEVYKTP